MSRFWSEFTKVEQATILQNLLNIDLKYKNKGNIDLKNKHKYRYT